MIERVTYECEFCHTHYGTAEEAEECEAKHIMPKSGCELLYRTGSEYPYRVILNFDDGKKITFDARGYEM